MGSKQGVHLAPVKCCNTKGFPKRIGSHQGQLDVPCVENCILLGEDVFGEYVGDLFVGEDNLLRVDAVNHPHHIEEEWL